MRLKSIKLVGFKSFVEPTTVTFPSNMTSIVGPNGCGKSNIIDAVRWVMGESSAKHLRGEAMTDVIFNGATNRQPVGQATIELLFENTGGVISGEYSGYAEISIKRKVTREGVSQYYLNGSKCRRRDVTDIFLGTGMGPRSYAIIEQGMISRLIESKPEELRVYLEEAAGISKYKERRRDTENRMRRTQENLDRLNDIREELGKQLAHLKRQANAAERFSKYKKEQRGGKAKLNARFWEALEQKRLTIKNSVVTCETLIETIVVNKNAQEAKAGACRTELESMQSSYGQRQANYYKSGAEIAKLEQQLSFERKRLNKRDEELNRLHDEVVLHEGRLAGQFKDLAAAVSESDELGPILSELSSSRELGRKELEEIEISHAEQVSEWDSFQEALGQAQRDAERGESQVMQLQQSIRRLNERLARFQDERQGLVAEQAHYDVEMVSEELDALKRLLGEKQAALDTKTASYESSKEVMRLAQSKHQHAVKASDENSAVLAGLKAMQESMRVQTTGKIQDTFESLGLEARGLLVDDIQVKLGWETAVEAVLSQQLNRIKVNGFEGLANAKETAFEGLNVFDAKAADTSVANASAMPGTLAEKVKGSAVLNRLLNQFKPIESAVDAISLRRELPEGLTYITPLGVCIGSDWLQTPDSSAQASLGFLARRNQIDELEHEWQLLEDAKDLADDAVKKTNAASEALRASVDCAQGDFREAELAFNKKSIEVSAQKAKVEQFALRVSRNREDITEVNESMSLEQAELELLQEAWQEALLKVDERTCLKAELLTARESMKDRIANARVRDQNLQAQVHAKNIEKEKVDNRVRMLKYSVQTMEEATYRLSESRQTLLNEDADQGLLEELSLQLQILLETHQIDEEELEKVRLALDSLLAQLREFDSVRSQQEVKLSETRSELESLRMEYQAVELQQHQYVREVEENHADIIEVLSELGSEETVEALTEELSLLADRIQRLGPINLAAIDEYEEQSVRKNYLDEQDAELTEALDTLSAAIRKIDKETRTRFKETYDRVNAGLQELFPKIFGGGSAYLELTDHDMLETGVAIIAQPPGKKNSTIHLLSGGEKALTALALIFSIFKLNPAPFCMLDEVDAPLDDANVGRFANLVKSMSTSVQFIYISHNKVSMEMADQLMGVTMHEPGVSRLVSVDVEKAAEMAGA
jgi:chromosome segregation protein